MASAALETELAAGLVERLDDRFGKLEELSAQDVQTALRACDFIQTMFRLAGEAIRSALQDGVDARTFVARYEGSIAVLDSVSQAVARVLARARASHVPSLGKEFVARYDNLVADLTGLRQFLAEVIAKAKTPSRPIDWDRVHEAEAAYARHETEPVRSASRLFSGN